MTDTLAEHADAKLRKGEPLIEMSNIGKSYGAIRALRGINLRVNAGEVTCVLGDNGAGKSTLIKIMSGLHPHNEGSLKVDGQEVTFVSPREALDHGIATVYQDLAVVSLMEVWRNFFLGSELTAGKFPLAGMRYGWSFVQAVSTTAPSLRLSVCSPSSHLPLSAAAPNASAGVIKSG